MSLSVTELFIIFFFSTFFVAVIAFSAYGYMLILLLKDSRKFKPKGGIQFLKFLWMLLIYYISRSFAGYFGYTQLTERSFYMEKDKPIRAAESEQDKLRYAFTLFSSAYVLFFVFLIATGISLLYILVDQFL